jgi:hypothetical protein
VVDFKAISARNRRSIAFFGFNFFKALAFHFAHLFQTKLNAKKQFACGTFYL